MNFVNIERASQQQRLLYAQQVAVLRKAKGMRQQDLADAAMVDRKTIGNIERGAFAPQPDVLRRVFAALGVPTEANLFDEDTVRWAEMIATLISRIPVDRRSTVVQQLLEVLMAEIRAGVGGGEETPDNVVALHTIAEGLDVDTIEAETRRAATTDDSAPNEFDTPTDDDPR